MAKRSFAPVGAVGDEAAVVDGGVRSGAAVDEVIVDGREEGEGERRKDV